MTEKTNLDDDGFLECYIRFNDDSEKDYCFQVKVNTRFNELFKIFDSLPISLRPSVFYHSRPVGFQVCDSPGYLTEDGAILFDDKSRSPKYLQNIDLNDKIGSKIWPGQLIAPVWQHNDFGFYSFVSLLLVWLYTDLPDFISPTPGICLTNQLSKLVYSILMYFDKPKIAAPFIEDLTNDIGIVPQIVFFVFHLIKCGSIFLFLYLGIFNPIKVFKFLGPKGPSEITREQLLEIGWTGSKRATIEEYKEYYRNYRIKQYKSMVEAHHDGLFDRLKSIGVLLDDTEGFNTPIDSKLSTDDMKKGDFKLNYQYLAHLGNNFENYIKQDDLDVNEAVKQFRRYGLLSCDELVREIVDARKAKVVEVDSNL